MATTTPRIGLTKPDGTDLVDIAVLNTNFDKIDSNIASTKIQATKPTTANAGDLWWDSDTGTLYLYYVDANSSQWVAATSDPINIGVVASQAERDAQYPTPAQGMSVYRTDLGVTQRYYGLFNASTNPGGRDTAGWYNTEKSIGLIPVRPTTVTVTGGTASTNSMGVVSFGNATAITVDGFMSSNKTYRIVIQWSASTNNALLSRFVKNGTIHTTGYYGASSFVSYNTALGGDQFRDNAANGFAGYSGNIGAISEIIIRTSSSGVLYNYDSYNTDRASYSNGGYSNIGIADITGIHLYPNTGNIGGTIAIYEMINS